MPLAPEEYYAFDQSWPPSGSRVIMTPMRVWYPLTIGAILFMLEVIFLA